MDIEPFKDSQLKEISVILSHINTGSEITKYLICCSLPDPEPENTKWKRLYSSFTTFQNAEGVANNIIKYITVVLDPVFYTNAKEKFQKARDDLNRLLAFSGLEFQDDGKMHKVPKARDINESIDRVQRLRSKLDARHAHPDIYRFAAKEITSDNYFHTVLEAMKSVTEKNTQQNRLLCRRSKVNRPHHGRCHPTTFD